MPKRSNRRAANGAGTIKHRSDGRWEAQYITGTDPATGKYIRKSVYARTQTECRKKLNAAIAAIDSGTYADPEKITVRQWLSIWLETYCGHLAPRTRSMYAGFVNNRIIPALGAMKLDKLNAPAIQRFYNDLIDELSPKTISNIHGILHKALKQAQEMDYIQRNPAERVMLPRIEKAQIKPLLAAEMAAFVEAIKGSPFECLLLVALFTGMRQGELLGLTWDRVDQKAGTITIDRQLQIIDHAYQFTPPKHNKVRVIHPAPFIMKLLRKQHARQLEWKLQTGECWNNTGFVFSNEIGEHLARETVYSTFKKLAGQIGRPDARFHDLRHPYVKPTTKKI